MSEVCTTAQDVRLRGSIGVASGTGRCKSWTLDSGLDHGLDRGLDGGLDFGPKFGPSFGLASINRLFRLARRCQSMV